MNLIILDTPYTCHEPDLPLLLQNGCKTLLYFLGKHVHFVASADSLHSTGQGLHTQYARETLCRPAIVSESSSPVLLSLPSPPLLHAGKSALAGATTATTTN